MSKKIYEMLNEVNVDLEELQKQDFTDFEKSKIKKRFKKSLNKNKNYKKYIAAASIFFVSLCLLNENLVSYAKEIIDDITYSISRALGIPADLKDYTRVINKSISKHGIEISLNEVILNNDEIVFTYTVKSDKKLEDIGDLSVDFSRLLINSKEVGGLGGGGGKQIDEYTQEHSMRFTLFGIEENELKGNVDIKINFDEAIIGKDKVVKGPWEFEFKADGKQLALDTEEIKLNKTFELENGAKLILEKYTKNDMGEKIYTRIEGYEENKYYDVYIKGIDDSGTSVKFMMTNCSNNEPVLEREDASFSLDAKNIKLSVYVSQEEYSPNKSDYKLVGEEFMID